MYLRSSLSKSLCLAALAPFSFAQGVKPIFDAPVVVMGIDQRMESVVDIDGDGWDDVVSMWRRTVGFTQNAGIFGWLNDGEGGVDLAWQVLIPDIAVSAEKRLVTGDLNGDGRGDVVASMEGEIHVLLSQGGVAPVDRHLWTRNGDHIAGLGDFDGDGLLDLAITNHVTGIPDTVGLYVNGGDGTSFTPSHEIELGTATLQLTNPIVICDLDDNDTDDLAIATTEGVRLHPVLDGVMQPSIYTWTGVSGGALTFGDIDADGDGDFVYFGSQVYSVLRHVGPSTFVSEALRTMWIPPSTSVMPERPSMFVRTVLSSILIARTVPCTPDSPSISVSAELLRNTRREPT